MSFFFRESNEIREIKSVEGKVYFLQKSAYGFGEEYIFYDENKKEVERFSPSPSDYFDVDGFYLLEEEEIAVFEGRVIQTKFSFSEFYE